MAEATLNQVVLKLKTEDQIVVSPECNATITQWESRGHSLLTWIEQPDHKAGGIPGLFFPWGGRVPESRFDWADNHYDFQPFLGRGIRNDGHGHALHGLFTAAPWRVTATHTHEDEAAITLTCDTRNIPLFAELFHTEAHITATYTLKPGSLELHYHIHNQGRSAFPFAGCVHPWFRLPEHLAEQPVYLQIPARQVVESAHPDIPVPKCVVPVHGPVDYRLRTRLPEKSRLDTIFTDLEADADGWVTAGFDIPSQYSLRLRFPRSAFRNMVAWHPDQQVVGYANLSLEPQVGLYTDCHPLLAPITIAPGGEWQAQVRMEMRVDYNQNR